MSGFKTCAAGFALSTCLFLAPNAFAQEESSSEGDWRFSAYLWGMSLEGDVGIGPINADIDLSFSDILESFDIGGAVVARYDRGDHVFVFDFQYYSLKPDAVSLPGPLQGSVSTKLKMPVINTFYGHRYNAGRGFIGPTVGARYMQLDLTLDLDLRDPLPSQRRTADPDLTDATFGGLFSYPLGENWEMLFQADYGLGTSDGTYQAQLLFQRIMNSGNRWTIGARIMGVDFDDTLPNGELFNMDTTMAGLALGFTWDP